MDEYKPRLIDANALRDDFRKYFYEGESIDMREVIERIDLLAPTIDAEPVRHAYWAHRGYIDQCCSLCGGGICREYPDGYNKTPDYCSDCGAKMDRWENQ